VRGGVGWRSGGDPERGGKAEGRGGRRGEAVRGYPTNNTNNPPDRIMSESVSICANISCRLSNSRSWSETNVAPYWASSIPSFFPARRPVSEPPKKFSRLRQTAWVFSGSMRGICFVRIFPSSGQFLPYRHPNRRLVSLARVWIDADKTFAPTGGSLDDQAFLSDFSEKAGKISADGIFALLEPNHVPLIKAAVCRCSLFINRHYSGPRRKPHSCRPANPGVCVLNHRNPFRHTDRL